MKHKHLNRTSKERRYLTSNLITELLRHERIKTTVAKAKFIKPAAEKVIALGKQGSVSALKLSGFYVKQPEITAKLFSELAARYRGRAGGFVRIARAGRRYGDAAPMAYIELLDNNKENLLMNHHRKIAKRWIEKTLKRTGQTLTPTDMTAAIHDRVDVQKQHLITRARKYKYTPIELLLRPKPKPVPGISVQPLDDLD